MGFNPALSIHHKAGFNSGSRPTAIDKNDTLICMRKYIRNYVEGGTYFFTLVTKYRKPIFQDPACCELFMDGVEK